MRCLWLFVAGMLCVSVAAFARPIPIDPSSFKTNATFSIDNSVSSLTTAIATIEPDVKSFLQNYRFDGKNLKLKSKGSYVCDMKFMGIPNQKFSWDIDLSVPVFEKMTAK